MRAAILGGAEDLQIMEKDKPEPKEGEVLVKIEYCGICGSDLHAYKSGMFPFGMTIGHEYAGVIEAVGAGVDHLEVGQAVTGTASLACRTCPSCLCGRDNICEAMNVIGVTRDGAMADYLAVPKESINPLPAGMTLMLGALAEPYSVALHGVNLVGVSPEQTALILGAGAIGLCLLAELKRRGVEKVLVADINEERLAAAREMGATTTINSATDNLEKITGEFTSGAGADLLFECVGLPDTIREAPNLVRQGGTIVVLGICEIPVDLFFLGLVTREIQIRTAYGATAEEFTAALNIIAADEEKLAPLVRYTAAFDELAGEGFAPLLKEDCPHTKILVKIN